MFKGLDTKLNFSTSYHPQMDGKTERVNQVLEDILNLVLLKYCMVGNAILPLHGVIQLTDWC